MKTKISRFSALALLALSGPALAAGSLQHLGNSIDHSAQAIAHGSIAGVKLVSAAIAIPLLAAGEIGKVSGDIGEELWDEANSTLPIADEIMTAGPSPAKAMKKEDEK